MDEILPKEKEIPEIPNVDDYPEILNAARAGNLVVFVGAGVSAVKGYYVWNEYAKRKIEAMNHLGIIPDEGKKVLEVMVPRKALTICKMLLLEDGNDVKEKMLQEDILLGSESENESKIYDYLYDFDTTFITTNYDKCLDKIIDMHNRNIVFKAQSDNEELLGKVETNGKQKEIRHAYSEDKDFLVNRLNEHGNVFHIHGSFDNMENMTVTIKDYLQKYSSENTLPRFLKYLFSQNTVLFIGYGLEEMEVLDTIINAGKTIQTKTHTHYCLSSFHQKNDLSLFYSKKYYASLNIHLIPYSRDKHDNILEEIIRIWAKKISPISREPSLKKDLDFMDGVLKNG